MAAFEPLLVRFRDRTSFGQEALALESFRKRDGPPIEKAWQAWAEAERAMHLRSPQLALAWLAAGRGSLTEPPDPPLAAELLSTETRCWLWLDEPREAIGPAHGAWLKWLELARDPREDLIVSSARALLTVLSEPHAPPGLTDQEVHRAWLMDRFTRQFESAPRRLMGIYADLRQVEAAQAVADDYLAWVDERVAQTFGTLSGTVVAGFLIALGDVYDRCGDSEGALATFRDGLNRLVGAPEIGEIVWKRAQLHFNSANQLGKLGRQEEALEALEAARGGMTAVGAEEATLRVRYALVVTKYDLGREEGLVDELVDLAAEYEAVLAKAGSGPEQIAAWQGLNLAYRLWLRLSVERVDTEDAGETLFFFHQLYALKEEEGKLTRFWRMARDRPEAEIHSEISVMVDRLDQRSDTGLLVIEQVPEALIVVSFRPGPGSWNSRVTIQVIEEDCVEAITDVIRAQRDVIDRMADQSISVDSAPSEAFLNACGRAWQVLSEEIRQDIDSVETLMVSLDNQTQLDEFPVELLHDGTTYLGLRKDVLRVPSLNDLNVLLGENRTNASSTGSAIVVRAEDDLSQANAEAQAIESRIGELGIAPRVRAAPDETELLAELGAGVDLLHYVGHGLADEIGEVLPLGPDKRLTARQVGAIQPAPAPVAILSACLVGRGRQLRTGHQQGFVPALLRRGSPGVVAAKYVVGDDFAAEYAALLYRFLAEETLPAAVRATRNVLAEEKYHPAAWSLFVVFGQPDVRIQGVHRSEAGSWPSAVFRYLATGSETHLALAQFLLETDGRLPEESRSAVTRDLVALASEDAEYFHPGIMAESRGLQSYSEAAMASNLVRAFGVMRHGPETDSEQQERLVHQVIGQTLLAEQILGDTYLLVAAAVEMRRRTHLYLNGEGKADMLRARRRLRWLSADDDALAEARSVLDPREE